MISRVLLFVSAALLSFSVCAEDLNISVMLSKLEAVRTAEKRGDELYISVTEYGSSTAPINYLVPEFPMHWLSRRLEEVKNVTLWANSFKEGEGAAVIFSLIERNMPPWDLDDLIGTIKLKVRNTNGKLKKQWVLPHQKGFQVIQADKNEFILKSDAAEYHIFLELKEHEAQSEFMKQRKNLIRPNPITGL